MPKGIDFEEVKERCSIQMVAETLYHIKLRPSRDKFRAPCPVCNAGGDRALLITPAKGVYFCFGKCERGGSVLDFVAHMDGMPRDKGDYGARKLYGMFFANSTVDGTVHSEGTVPEKKAESQTKKLAPLSHLVFDHEAVEAVGLDVFVAERFGIGYRTKGAGQGSVMIPVRNEDGDIEGYVGVQELTYVPKDFQPPENVVPFKKKA